MRLHRRDGNTTDYLAVPHFINPTLTSSVTSRGLIRTGFRLSPDFAGFRIYTATRKRQPACACAFVPIYRGHRHPDQLLATDIVAHLGL